MTNNNLLRCGSLLLLTLCFAQGCVMTASTHRRGKEKQYSAAVTKACRNGNLIRVELACKSVKHVIPMAKESPNNSSGCQSRFWGTWDLGNMGKKPYVPDIVGGCLPLAEQENCDPITTVDYYADEKSSSPTSSLVVVHHSKPQSGGYRLRVKGEDGFKGMDLTSRRDCFKPRDMTLFYSLLPLTIALDAATLPLQIITIWPAYGAGVELYGWEGL